MRRPGVRSERTRVYRHALAAIRCAMERGAGSHGLALIGGGDWNDGMNRVGAGGRGESVWLTWFLALVLRKFAPVCRHMEEPQLAEELLGRAEGYRKAAEAAWDGSWYRRGYFDSGAPLGTRGRRAARSTPLPSPSPRWWRTRTGSGPARQCLPRWSGSICPRPG